MKIERDKWYVTRGGDKVRVVCVDAPGNYPVIGIDDEGAREYTSDGRFYNDDSNCNLDLVSEHPEPARVWANQSITGAWHVYGSAETANQYAGDAINKPTRIAVEFVEVVK